MIKGFIYDSTLFQIGYINCKGEKVYYDKLTEEREKLKLKKIHQDFSEKIIKKLKKKDSSSKNKERSAGFKAGINQAIEMLTSESV